MRGRKDHVITQTEGDAQPARLVGIAVDSRVDGIPGESTEQRERLLSWAGSGWERSAAGTYRTWDVADADVTRLWRAFIWGAKRRGVTWLIAHRAVRCASLLGLWGMIERGELEWDGVCSDRSGRRERDGDVSDVPGGDGAVNGRGRSVNVGSVRTVPVRPAAGGRHLDADGRSTSGANPSVIIDDPPTVLRMRVPGRPGRLWLMDIRNWGIEPEREWDNARQEAQWLADTMRRMVGELTRRGWGGLKATAGSQALATWRRSYMTHAVTAHNDDEVLELEERSYVGGRCECGRLGTFPGPLYMIDRRSAYGHACATLEVPLAVRGRRDGQWQLLNSDPVLAGRCCAEARVTGGEPSCPQVVAAGVRYPSGRRTVCLAGPELRDAVERGYLDGIGRCVEYHVGPALRGYARAVWDARQTFAEMGVRALEQWAKKLLVCLPGKLGQRIGAWVPDARRPPALWCCWWGADHSERTHYRLRSLSGSVQRQERADWTYDSVPAVASWILSCARVELLRAIRVAGWDECLYWDTDSLLLSQRGWDALLSSPGMVGSDLGQWRLVSTVDRAAIHGVKHYDLDGVVKCAGMPRADVAETRIRDHYWYRQTFGVALGEFHAPRAARRLRKYARAPQYHLGRIGDGGRVYPFVANDW